MTDESYDRCEMQNQELDKLFFALRRIKRKEFLGLTPAGMR